MSLYEGFKRTAKWNINSDVTLMEAIEMELKASKIHSSIVYMLLSVEGLKCIINHNEEEIEIFITRIVTKYNSLCVYFNTIYPVKMKHIHNETIDDILHHANLRCTSGMITYNEDTKSLNYRNMFEYEYDEDIDINHFLNQASVAIDDALDYFDKIREQYNLYV